MAVAKLEDEQLPQPQRVVARPREVLAEQPGHKDRLEKAALLRARRSEHVEEETGEPAAEPAAERHPEALLAPVENRVGQQRAEGFLEDVFPSSVADLEARRQRRREVDHLV